MEIFKLFGSIFVDNEEANKSISKTEEKAEGLGSKLGNGIKTAAKWGTAIVGGATVAAGGLMGVATKTAETTDRIDKMSQKLGLSREAFQEWDFITSQSGANIDSMQSGMKTLTNQFDELGKGGKVATDAFGRLGLTYDDLAGKSREEIFETTISALQNMEDETERAAIANDLLGKSGSELAPLLNAGAGAVEEMKKQAHDLGLVIGDDAVDAGVQFTDTMDQLKRSFGAMATGIGASILPMMQEFAEFVLANMPTIQEVLRNVMNSLSDAVAAVLPFLMDLIQNALPPLIDLFTQIASDILPPVITLFTDILQAVLPPLIELFSGIITTILPPLMDLLTIIIEDILPPFIDLFNDVISAILPPLMELFSQIIDTLLPPLIDLFKQIIDAIMPVLIELFNTFVEVVLPPLMELITEIVDAILPPLLDIFNELAEIVLPLVITVFESLVPIIEPIMQNIANIINIILALIKGDWEGVWEGIKTYLSNGLDTIMGIVEGFKGIFVGIFEAIGKLVSGIWNGLVNHIKNNINNIIKLVNVFIGGLNKLQVPDWVPGVGGKGINIPKIPLLAEGGEIVQRGYAIVGEAGPEMLELPQGAKVKPLAPDENEDVSGKTIIEGNNFYIREESDIKKVARELFKLQEQKRRGGLVLT